MLLLLPALLAGGYAFTRRDDEEVAVSEDLPPGAYGPELPPSDDDDGNNPVVPDFIEEPAEALYEDLRAGARNVLDKVPETAGAVSRNAVGTFVLSSAAAAAGLWLFFKVVK